MTTATHLQVPQTGISATQAPVITFHIETSPRLKFIHLTESEKAILTLSAQDMDTKEISKAIFKSPRTIETIRQNLKDKLQVSTIAGMIAKAIYLKLISPNWKPSRVNQEDTPPPILEDLVPSYVDEKVNFALTTPYLQDRNQDAQTIL